MHALIPQHPAPPAPGPRPPGDSDAAGTPAVGPHDTAAEAVLALTDDAVLVVRGGIVESANPAAERLFGLPANALTGRPVAVLLDPAPRDDAPTGASSAEVAALRADGERRTAMLRSAAVCGTADVPAVVHLLRDRTDEHGAAEELRLLQNLALAIGEAVDLQSAMRLALEMVGDVTGWTAGETWLPDAAGETLRRGPVWAVTSGFAEFHEASERMTFERGAGLPGRVWASGRAEWVEDVLQDRDFVRTALAEACGLRTGIAIPVLAGREVVAVITFFHTEVRDRDARMIGLVSQAASQLGTLIQRRRTEEALHHHAQELARSNAELEQFAYVASHDLQEPLRMVASYTQLLAKRYGDRLDPDAHEFIGYAVEGVTRMQQLIHDLLAFSRVGTRGEAFAETPLESVIERVLHDIEPTIEGSGATITRDPLPVVEGDAYQIYQVFQNLIGNALKFRGEAAPRIHVAARREHGGWTLSVADNGIGIEEEFWPRIFVLFQRLHSRADYPGTGIGLSICKKIVERHGGRIWLQSSPGVGTTFHFHLPDREDQGALA
jgi:signal transduction histidine kinase